MFDPNEIRQYKIDKIETKKIEQFKKFIKNQKSILYLSNGRRSPIVKYTCRYSSNHYHDNNNNNNHNNHNPPIIVEGHFLPNRQSSDSNSNRRYDIFRCPISNSLELYQNYIHHGVTNLTVEIYRESTQLVKFNIPWKTRRSGFLVTTPRYASKFDPWKNYNDNHNNINHDNNNLQSNHKSDFYICTSRTVNNYATFDMVYRYLEFIQHHILIGTTHIFLSVPYSWNSPSMNHLIQTFKPFIQNKQLTIMSESGDNINLWGSTLGIKWTRLAIRNLQINNCLYLAKGMAEYLGVWDVNEYFLPQLPHHTIQDVINSVVFPFNFSLDPNNILPSNVNNWKGGVGLADGDGHPLCYLKLSGYTTLLNAVPQRISNHWIHGLYNNGILKEESLSKSILPTNVIHQGGLHLSGGCKLDYQWTSCSTTTSSSNTNPNTHSTNNQFCYTDIPDFMYIADQLDTKSLVHSIPSQHNFDDIILARDIKLLNPQTDGYLLNFGGLAGKQKSKDESTSKNSKNPYIQHYSERVLEALKYNGIDFQLKNIPEESPIDLVTPNVKNNNTPLWQDFETVFPPVKDKKFISIPYCNIISSTF